MTDLPFDTMIPNTQLAENYFKQHNHVFYDGDEAVRFTLTDGFNTIESRKDATCLLKNIDDKDCKGRKASEIHLIDFKLMKLRKELEINANLFSQIEFLIRKVPIDDVLNCDLKLISQNILYNTTTSFTTPIKRCTCILMDNSPLALFGSVVQILRKFTSCMIIVSRLRAVVGHLFVELCHKVGLNEVELIFDKRSSLVNIYFKNLDRGASSFDSGCVGVITENGDIDSAVDVLIETTVRHPWQLRRILVQENVYTTFKNAMRWKTQQDLGEQTKFSAESFSYKGKQFFLDYTQTDRINEYIAVESYRTTKELLTLLNKYNNFYMSLWTSSLVESNEITHYASSDIVWINHFGVFDGPPQASQAIYGAVFLIYCPLVRFFVSKNWSTQQKDWLKLSFHERCSKINFCLSECYENFPQLHQFLTCLRDWQPDSVYSDNGKTCVCTTKPRNMICYKKIKQEDSSGVKSVIRLLALGYAIIDNSESDVVADFTRKMSAIGAPILTFSTSEFENSVAIEAADLINDDFLCRTKVVYSNFGTIFAN
ncbi:unnamed protein product [Chilo suppressalis]|uniref:Aldehyde dehydrogenase domain-containing protein n=1 Tax=Chilo suppressalis TaxID=168631 RepID=A0ABN8AZ11_CHISP|nr:unnamed protein product [Chilo suppressalis]